MKKSLLSFIIPLAVILLAVFAVDIQSTYAQSAHPIITSFTATKIASTVNAVTYEIAWTTQNATGVMFPAWLGQPGGVMVVNADTGQPFDDTFEFGPQGSIRAKFTSYLTYAVTATVLADPMPRSFDTLEQDRRSVTIDIPASTISPVITGVTPSSLGVGTVATIQGSNFLPSDNFIWFQSLVSAGYGGYREVKAESIDGRSLSFTIPTTLIQSSEDASAPVEVPLTSGTYQLGVSNENGKSNPFEVYVKGSDPTSTCYNFTKDLKVGSIGADVVALQSWLIANGYDIKPISSGLTPKGYFGVATADALRKYQIDKSIPERGYVGQKTRDKLNASCNGSSKLVIDLTSSGIETKPANYTVEYKVSFDGTRYDPATITLELACSSVVTWVSPASGKKNTCTNRPDNNTGVDMQRVNDGEYRVTIVFYNSSNEWQPILAIAKVWAGVSGKTLITSDKDGIKIPPLGSMVPPGIVVLPNGGESYKTGQPLAIKWDARQIPSDSVKIELGYTHTDPTYAAGMYFEDLIVLKTKNTGSYTWTIPEYYATGVVPSSFLVKVSGEGVSDYSDGKFVIAQGKSKTDITVTRPAAGEGYYNGETVPISWKSDGKEGYSVSLLRKDDPSFLRLSLDTAGHAPNLTWKIPDDIPNGYEYYFKVNEGTYRNKTGYSGTFAIKKGLPVTPYLITSLVSLDSQITRRAENQGEGDQATYYVTFNITANTDVYISNKLSFAKDGAPTPISDNLFSVKPDDKTVKITGTVMTSKTYHPEDTTSFFAVAEGTTRQFTAAVSLEKILSSGYASVVLNSLSYRPNSPNSISQTQALDSSFKTPYLSLNYIAKPVATPFITVVNPDGGGYWYTNQKVAVEWKTSGIPSNNQMTIRLRSYDTGQEYPLLETVNDGYESFMLPATVPNGPYTLEIKTAVNNQSYLDASYSYFKIINQVPTASASILSGTQTNSVTPTIYGTATGVSKVGVVLGDAGGKAYGSGLIEVLNERWSVTVPSKIKPGTYTIYIYDANNKLLTTRSLNIVISETPAPTVSLDTNPKLVGGNSSVVVQYGEEFNISWTSANATSCTFIPQEEEKDGNWSGWAGPVEISGSVSSQITSNTTFTVTCTNSNGISASASIRVDVTSATQQDFGASVWDAIRNYYNSH